MKVDEFGQFIYTEDDLCDLYMEDPTRDLSGAFVTESIHFTDIESPPKLRVYKKSNKTKDRFDADMQSDWFMPVEYANMDIAKWVLEQCKSDAELQRAGYELLQFSERKMFPLLCYLKYFVDTMRKHKLVWGVGRGSSVSSFVLYLIGVHKINSLVYGLDVNEFLK